MSTVLAALLLVSHSAQIDTLEFYKQISSIDTLQSKPVQSELKVSESQRSAMNKHATAYTTEAQSLAESVKSGGMPRAEFAKKLGDAQSVLQVNVIKELSQAQVTRLGQITLQRAGIIALVNPLVSNQIGLTQAQRKTLVDGLQKTGETVAEVERKAKEPIVKKYQAMNPKTDEEKAKLQAELDKELQEANGKIQGDLLKARKGFEDLVDKTLTPGQKKSWTELKGPIFKVAK